MKRKTAEEPAPKGLNENRQDSIEIELRQGRRLLSVDASGAYIGVSRFVMAELIHAGVIPTVKIPSPTAKDGRVIRRLLVDRGDLDSFVDRNKERAE